MSTPNFHNENGKYVYAIDDDGENTDWDLIEEMIEEELRTKGFEIQKDKWLGDRNYNGKILGEKIVWDKKEIYSYCLKAIIRSGYYSGANLDWELDWIDVYNNEYDEINIADILISADFIETPLTEKQAEAIEQKLRASADEDIEKLEKLYSKLSTPLVCRGIFSNGEAVYEKAK